MATKIAAFDVGTNTVLMLAVEITPGEPPRKLLDLARITRIGKGVDRTGQLDPEAAQRTLSTIVEFAAAAREAGVTRFTAVATSAVRDASNGAEFIAQVKRRAGVDLRIISGREEAELSHLAVVRGLDLNPKQKLLIVDVGGGSTELIAASPGEPLKAESLQMGSVRLTERLIAHDPPTPDEIAAINAVIDQHLDLLEWNSRPDALVGIAGTVTTICAVALALDAYDPGRVHGCRLSREEVSRVSRMFADRTIAERKKFKGLLPERADVIFAGALILERIMERFGAREVIVSDQGVRWGLVWREAESAQPADK
jgi:exopolyphosphatase/guanosine-5'-triphosphate,3'-diphosphate pyrophosphatase